MRFRGFGWWLLAALVVGGLLWRWITGQQVFASWADQRRYLLPLAVVLMLCAPVVVMDIRWRIRNGRGMTRDEFGDEVVRLSRKISWRR